MFASRRRVRHFCTFLTRKGELHMRTISAAVFSSILLLVPAFATAQDSAAPAAAAAPAPASAPAATAAPAAPAQESVTVNAPAARVNLDEVVCKQTPPKTGSRLGGARECHTVREWNRWQLDSRNALMHQQQMGNIQMGKGG
jgi:hypothetical protein